MQVKIGKVILAGSFKESVKDYHYSVHTDAQIGKVFRSTPRLFDRGNKYARMSFTVQREHESPTSAVAFMLDHPETFPSDGGILEVSLSYGGKSIKRFFTSAVIEVSEEGFIGASTTHTYTILGVNVTKSLSNKKTITAQSVSRTSTSSFEPFEVVSTRSEMKALASDSRRSMVFVTAPEPGVARCYVYAHGDTSTPDDISIVQPDDNGGRYFQFNP